MKHEIFKTNPNLKEVHMTSDGECFYNDNDAKMHAKSLEEKKVEIVLNPDHIQVECAEEVETEEAAEETTETKATLELVGDSASTEATSTEAQKEEVKKASTTKNSSK